MDRSAELLIDGLILIQAQTGNDLSKLVERVTQIPGVTKALRVQGPYDVIAEVRANGEDARTLPVEDAIRELDGVLRAIPLGVAAARASASAGEAA